MGVTMERDEGDRMKTIIALLAAILLALSGCSTPPAQAAAPAMPVLPSATPTPEADPTYPPSAIDPIFLRAVRLPGVNGSPDYAIWATISDTTVITLGHSISELFITYGGTLACDVDIARWGTIPGTDICEPALLKTIAFMDRSAADNGLPTTTGGNAYFIGAAIAAYLQ
jgi:hypothetical protein